MAASSEGLQDWEDLELCSETGEAPRDVLTKTIHEVQSRLG